MASCLFCQIVAGERPADRVYEDSEVLVFRDIKPVAKHHYLVIPKRHIKNAKSLTSENVDLVQTLVNIGKTIVQNNDGDLNDLLLGFHWPPFNSIEHLHLHVISPASSMGFFAKLAFKPNTWWFVTADYVLERLQSSKL